MKHKIYSRPKKVKDGATGFTYWLWRTGGYDAARGDYGRCACRQDACKIIRSQKAQS